MRSDCLHRRGLASSCTHTDTDFLWTTIQPCARNAAIIVRCSSRTVLPASCTFVTPAGLYDRRVVPVLRAINIETATTVDPVINFPGTDPLLLTRFLDGTSIGEVEFVAEMSGVGEILAPLSQRAETGQPAGGRGSSWARLGSSTSTASPGLALTAQPTIS